MDCATDIDVELNYYLLLLLFFFFKKRGGEVRGRRHISFQILSVSLPMHSLF